MAASLTLLHLSTPSIADYAELSLRTKQDYAARHGLGLAVVRDTLDASRPPSWSKILLCQRELDRPRIGSALTAHSKRIDRADWLWWLDADAAITTPKIDVRQYCDEMSDMVITEDGNGINCGSFLLRNSDGARRLLDATWNRTALIHHQWWEQGAMHAILREKPGIAVVKVIPQRTINSYHENWQAGDLVVHLAGKSHGERAELMRKYAK